MATVTVDLPAFGCLAPGSGVRDDALSTPDTSSEITISNIFQDIAVGTYGGGAYDPAVNVALTAIPDGATVTGVHYVTIAYRESGSDITVDTHDGLTPHASNQPFLYLDSSARSSRFTLDSLPIGGYAGETLSTAEGYASLQLDHPLNRAWYSYATDSGPVIHVAYLAIRITYTTVTNPPGLRIYPPVNNGKFGPTRHHPRTVNRRAGGTY